MNKKAMIVNMLVTIVLAILVFGSASVIIAKVLGVDEQGKQNFFRLHRELQEFAEKSKPGDLTGFTLILDEDTFVAKFDKGLHMVLSEMPPVTIRYPQEECQDKDCLVLCRAVQNIGKKVGDVYIDNFYICKDILAIPLSDGLKVNQFLAIRGTEILPGTSFSAESRREFLNIYRSGSDFDTTIHVVKSGQKSEEKITSEMKKSDLFVEKLVVKGLALSDTNHYQFSLQGKTEVPVVLQYSVHNSGQQLPLDIKIESAFFVQKQPASTVSSDSSKTAIFESYPAVHAAFSSLEAKQWFFLTSHLVSKPEETVTIPYFVQEVFFPNELFVYSRSSSGALNLEHWIFRENGNVQTKKIVSSAASLLITENDEQGKRVKHSLIDLGASEHKLVVKDYISNEEQSYVEGTAEYEAVKNQFDLSLIEKLKEDVSIFPISPSIDDAKPQTTVGVLYNPAPLGTVHETSLLLSKNICGCIDNAPCSCEICFEIDPYQIIADEPRENNKQCLVVDLLS